MVHFRQGLIYFHTLFWPAMLEFSGYKPPDHVYVMASSQCRATKCRSRAARASAAALPRTRMNPSGCATTSRRSSMQCRGLTSTGGFHRPGEQRLVGKYVKSPAAQRSFINRSLAARSRARRAPLSREFTARRRRSPRSTTSGNSARRCASDALADLANQFVDERSPGSSRSARAASPSCARCARWHSIFPVLTIYLKPSCGHAAQAERFLGVAPLRWRDAPRCYPRASHQRVPASLGRVEQKQLDQLFERPGSRTGDRHGATVSIDEFSKLDLRVARITSRAG